MESNRSLLASNAIQAIQELHNSLKRQHVASDMLDQSSELLQEARQLRSKLDGTAPDFEQIQAVEHSLQQARQLMLMHTPSSLTDDVRKEFANLCEDLLTGGVKKIVLMALVTCPWYASTQTDRGLQAKHNCLVVVYLHTHKQFFSPVGQHVKTENEVIDKGWFYAAEAHHFAQYLASGKSRFVELVFLPEESILYETAEWSSLRKDVNVGKLLGLRVFSEQSKGQAVGVVSKKNNKTGKMRLRTTATLHEFTESFRLLHHTWRALQGESLWMTDPTADPCMPAIGSEALHLMNSLYKHEDGDSSLHKLFELLMAWKEEIDRKSKTFTFTKPQEAIEVVSSWLGQVRMQGVHLQKSLHELAAADHEKIVSLLEKIGGNAKKLPPENILMIAQAGSHIYGLSTPDSDCDFVIIYKEYTEKIIENCTKPKETEEHRGPQLSVEYGAYEARLFCEMLWKGSVVINELVFVDEVDYASPEWKRLTTNKEVFLTERAINQYFGLIKNNLKMVESKKHMNQPRERKLFYQIYHKLSAIESMSAGNVPDVRCKEKTREFIMKIRKGPLEGEISREKLYKQAKEKIVSLEDILCGRKKRFPEDIDFNFLRSWLMGVRGWPDNT